MTERQVLILGEFKISQGSCISSYEIKLKYFSVVVKSASHVTLGEKRDVVGKNNYSAQSSQFLGIVNEMSC